MIPVSDARAAGEVTLREITFWSVRDVLALEVAEEQRAFVATNAHSIAEAHYNPGAWLRAIHAGEVPVGLVLLVDPRLPGALLRGPVEPGDIGLWRLMIDRRFQGNGYARGALDLLRARLRGQPGAERLVTSYRPGPDGPEGFYLHYGFRPTGRMRAGGLEAEARIAM